MIARIGFAVLAVLLAVVLFLSWQALALRTENSETLPSNGADAATDNPPNDLTARELTDNSAAFLAAWERDRSATYIALGTGGLRSEQGDAELEEVRLRHAGQSLLKRNGDVIYERDGVSETCRDTGQEIFCTPPSAVATPAEEAATMAELVAVPLGRYRVAVNSNDCFVLTLDVRRGSAVSDLGNRSTLCFDNETGGIAELIVEREKRTEFFTASDISNRAVEEDGRKVFPEPILDRIFAS